MSKKIKIMKNIILIRKLLLLTIVLSGSCAVKSQTVKPDNFDVRIAGKTIAEIKEGDVILPTFSPDGKNLAFSRVVVIKNEEFTEIAVLNLQSGKTKTLLTPKESEKYAAYATFVVAFEWLDSNRLAAIVSDGDVDSTQLTFDVAKSKLLNEKPLDEDPTILSSEHQNLRNRFIKAFPKLGESVIDNALQTASKLDENRLLVQSAHIDRNDDIYLFDLENKTETLIFKVPDIKYRFSFIGGFASGNDIIFALNLEDGTRIVRYRQGKSEILTNRRRDEHDYARFDVKFQSPEKTIFLLKTRGDS